MNYLMSIQLLPHHPGNDDKFSYISNAIEIIENSGLIHFVGPTETSVEGTMDELLNLVKKLNSYLSDEGCDEVITNIKLIQSVNDDITIKELLADYYEFGEDED